MRRPSDTNRRTATKIEVTLNASPASQEAFATLLKLTEQLLKGNTKIMTAIQDLDVKVDALSAEVEAANGKADALIAALVDVKAQLAALIAAGSGATDAEVNAVAAKVDAALASVQAQEAEDDAALV